MNTRKIDQVFGYGLLAVGVLKSIFALLVIAQIIINFTVLMNGGYINSNYYPNFSAILGLTQIIIALGSIVMIFVNIKRRTEAILGYLLGLGALAIEFIIPSFLMVFVVFAQCSLYIKAGFELINQNTNYKYEKRTNKKMIKDTDWFYTERDK